jgi:hypothetical protein
MDWSASHFLSGVLALSDCSWLLLVLCFRLTLEKFRFFFWGSGLESRASKGKVIFDGGGYMDEK